MKKIFVPLLLTLGLLLTIRVAQVLPTDVMSVIIGVVVGVSASVPTSLLLVALLRRERSSAPAPWVPRADSEEEGE